MSAHSHILGGSNAARLLACPASYAEQLKSPIIDVESSYAAEGTALHAAIANCIESKVKPEHIIGAEFYGHVIDEARAGIIRVALDRLDELLSKYGDPKRFRAIGIEETLPLPGVTGAFGSVDLILTDKRTVVVVDWKFGQGVIVKALVADSADSGQAYLNPQLAFYAAAARHAHRRQFKGKKIVLAIIQPKLENALDFVETDDAELDQFLDSFAYAYSEALGRNAYREKGEHCRFAPCKATCPLWTSAVFDLAVIDPVKAALKASIDVTGYGAFLSNALEMAEMAETWAEEIRKQGHVFIEDGGIVPGWKLVPKRATRKWTDPDTVAAELYNLGAEDIDMFSEPELKSVAQMEKTLKKKAIEIPSDLYQAISSGTTIVHDDDRRPDASHATVTVELRQALKAL